MGPEIVPTKLKCERCQHSYEKHPRGRKCGSRGCSCTGFKFRTTAETDLSMAEVFGRTRP